MNIIRLTIGPYTFAMAAPLDRCDLNDRAAVDAATEYASANPGAHIVVSREGRYLATVKSDAWGGVEIIRTPPPIAKRV